MVSPACFQPAEVRRYPSSNSNISNISNHSHHNHHNRGIPPYVAPYTDRRPGAYSAHHDSRGSIMSDRDAGEEPATQRKRIAVACGRCRKRKIRCTGDNGNGQPCLNCKNAGFEPCQFLRVASQEAPMKHEPFPYSLDVARSFQARGPSMVPSMPSMPSSSMPPYSEAAMHMPGSEAALPYRNGSAYAYSSKQCYPVSAWPSGYQDEANIDYAMYQQPYQPVQVQEPAYMVGYRLGPSVAASAKPSSSSSGYVDSEPAYGYSSTAAAAAATSMAHRPAAGAEAGGFSYQAPSAGLFNSVNSSERLLPTPSARPLPSSAGHQQQQQQHQHPYRTESVSSAYSKTSQSSNGGSSPAPLSEAPTSYSSFDNSPMTAYPPATLASQISRPSEAGSTAAASSSSEARFSPEPLRMTGPELTYKYTDTSRRYTSSYGGGMAHSSYIPQSHGQQHSSSSSSSSTSAYMVSGDDSDRKTSTAMRV